MARTQFTFTFTNAQPGSIVRFDNNAHEHLFVAATGAALLGHPLVLNSSNSLTVWTDAQTLTATTEDGDGNDISATATSANPSVTTDSGTAGQNPYSGASVAVVGRYVQYASGLDLSTFVSGQKICVFGSGPYADDGIVTPADDVAQSPANGTSFEVVADGVYVIEIGAFFSGLTGGTDDSQLTLSISWVSADANNQLTWGDNLNSVHGGTATGGRLGDKTSPVDLKAGEKFYVYVQNSGYTGGSITPLLTLTQVG